MYKGHRIGAVLLMGGEGARFGGKLPKQFHLLQGKPVYMYSLETLLATEIFDEICLVCHPLWMKEIEIFSPIVHSIDGKNTRQQSSYAGLQAFVKVPDLVLIHDAVRPFVTEQILLENIKTALVVGAANTCIPSTDTLVFAPKKNEIVAIPNRSEFLRGQTPQTFRYEWILAAHEFAKKMGKTEASDDCSLVLDLGYPVAVVQGSEKNTKITTALDLMIAQEFLNYTHRD